MNPADVLELRELREENIKLKEALEGQYAVGFRDGVIAEQSKENRRVTNDNDK